MRTAGSRAKALTPCITATAVDIRVPSGSSGVGMGGVGREGAHTPRFMNGPVATPVCCLCKASVTPSSTREICD